MNIERWDILDKNGSPTGRTALRGKNTLKTGEYHLVVHIWIVSSSGAFLIQRRSDNKQLMPGEWAATGGAAIAGEDSFTAARRELYEELGIATDRESLKKLFRIRRRNSLLDVWLTVQNIPVKELRLQSSEVAEAKWVSADELGYMIKSGSFHNYGKEYFDRVFEKIRRSEGAVL